MRHGLSKKKKRKDGMPKKHDPKKRKKMDTSMSMKKGKKRYIYIHVLMIIQIKEREIHKKSISFHHPPSTYVHDLDQLV